MKIPFNLQLANRSFFGQCKQERTGVIFDSAKAKEVLELAHSEMIQMEKEIEPTLPLKRPNKGESQALTPPKTQFKKDGSLSSYITKFFDSFEEEGGTHYGIKEVAGEEVRVELPCHKPIVDEIPMKMKDQAPIKAWLMGLGWKPTLWNVKKKADEFGKMRIVYPIEKTTPKFHEKGAICPNLESIGERIAIIKPIIRYLSLKNRKAVIEGWLSNPRLAVDNRLTPRSSGLTNTHRQKHAVVANVPKASAKVVLGKEMRSLFTVEKDRKMVGYDASGLEARVEAHYTYPYDNGTYAQELLDGDVHTNNAKIFYPECELDENGKAKPEWRDPSKNGKYALVYGAQPPRLADTLSIPLARAEDIWNDFWQMNASLGALKEAVEREWLNNDKVFITGLDGSKLYTRSQHSLVNTLFQNAGAVIMDLAGVLAEDEIERRGLDAKRVIYYHDEYAFDCAPDVVDEVGEIGVWSIKKAGEYFKLNVPLDADYSVGLTWGDVH